MSNPENERRQKQPSLFEQTKDLVFIGERLSGDPEVLHEVYDWARVMCSRPQIQKILESVPDVFPEDWQSPDGFAGLTEEQKGAYFDIARIGPFRLIGPEIQLIIQTGIQFRNRFQGKP